MSFGDFHRVIKENDTVILYNRYNLLYAIEVKPHILNKHGKLVPNIFQTTYGGLDVMSLVGQQFGSRVKLSRGWTVVLYPTPELWTVTLPHRTQILYSTDISMVLSRLNIGPDSVVCEAGTGSGSLSHAILRTLGPTGMLHTADFHEKRVEAAQEEFTRHGLGDRVSCSWRDVISLGWPITGGADAVFLDMPAPWLALHHAVNAVRLAGGRICSFSPCIEQVSRTCAAMRRIGLQNIRTVEVLARELQVRKLDLPIVTIQQDDRPIRKKEKPSAHDKSAKRIKLNDASDTKECDANEGAAKSNSMSTNSENTKSEVDISIDGTPNSEQNKSANITDRNSDAKDSESRNNDTNQVSESRDNNDSKSNAATHGAECRPNDVTNGASAPSKPAWSRLVCMPVFKQPGHTGFLTFCVVPPAVPRPVLPVEQPPCSPDAPDTVAAAQV